MNSRYQPKTVMRFRACPHDCFEQNAASRVIARYFNRALPSGSPTACRSSPQWRAVRALAELSLWRQHHDAGDQQGSVSDLVSVPSAG